MIAAAFSATAAFAAPLPPTISGNDGDRFNSLPSFTITGEADGVQIDWELDGPLVSGVSGESGLSPLSTGPVGTSLDGVHTLRATQTDAVPETSTEAVRTFVLDREGPAAPGFTGTAAALSNDDTPTFTWTEPEPGGSGYRWEVRQNGNLVDSGSTLAGTLTLSALPDGTFTFRVRQLDDLGNEGAWATSAAFTIDTANPGVPTVTAPPSPTNDATPSFSWSAAEAGGTFDWDVQGADPRAGSTSSSGVTIDPALADGAHQFRVRQVDAAGNQGPYSTLASLTVDTDAPAAPSLTAGPPLFTQDGTPDFGWTASENGGSFQWQVTGGDPRSGSTVSSSLTLPGPALSDGAHSFSVRHVDAAGNESPFSTTWDFTVDTDAPGAPTLGTVPATISNDDTPDFTWTGAESGGDYFWQVRNGTTVIRSGTTALTSLSVAPEVADGTYNFRVQQIDTAGNAGAFSTQAAFTIDTAAPPAPAVTGPPANGNDSTPAVSWTGQSGATFEWQVLSGATIVRSGSTTSAGVTIEPALGDGAYGLEVRQIDAAGNPGPFSSTIGFNIDTGAPAAPTLTAFPPPFGNDATPTFEWSADEAGGTFAWEVRQGANVIAGNTTAATSVTVSPALADGSYSFRVRQVDAAGNLGAQSSALDFTVDTGSPSAPTLGTLPPATSNNPTPSFSWTGAEAGGTYFWQVRQGTTEVLSATIAGNSAQTTPLPDGDYTFRVRQIDAAGNLGAFSAVHPFEIDTQSSTAPTLTGTPPAVGNNPTPGFAWDPPAPGGSFVWEVRQGTTVVRTATTTELSVDVTPALSDGAYDFAVRHLDGAGNPSPESAVFSFVIDTGSPGAPNITQAPAAISSQQNPTFAWTAAESGGSFAWELRQGATVVRSGTTANLTVTTSPDLSDGSYSFVVRQVDAATNAGAFSAAAAFAVDTTPPAAPTVTSTPPTPSSDDTPTVAWAPAESGGTFQWELRRGTPLVASGSTSSGSVSFAPLVDGSYSFRVRHVDDAGNPGPYTSDVLFVIDTAGPGAPSFNTVPSTLSNDTTPSFSWSKPDPAGGDFEWQLLDVTGLIVVLTDTGPSQAVTLSALADGDYRFRVRQFDALGNPGAFSAEDTFAIDATAPTAPLLTIPPVTPSPDTSPSFQWTAGEAGGTFAWEVRPAGGGAPIRGGTTSSPSVTVSPVLENGSFEFVVRHIDAATNQSPFSTTFAFVVDSSAPAAPVVGTGPPAVSNITTPAFSWTPAETGGTFEWQVRQGSTVVSTDTTATTSATVTPALAEGTYTFRVRQIDAAGNPGPFGSYAISFVVDISVNAPALTSVPSTPTNDATPHFAWTAPEPGGTFKWKVLAGGTTTVVRQGELTATSVDVTPAIPSDGTYEFVVVHVDDALNESAPSGLFSFVLDTTAPAAPSITLAPPALANASHSQPAFAWTAVEAGGGFDWQLLEGLTVARSGSTTTTGVTITPALAEGDYSFQVRKSDVAGNTGPFSTPATFTLDTTAPGVPVLSSRPPTPTAGLPSYAFTWSEEPDTTSHWQLLEGATVRAQGNVTTPASVSIPDTFGPGDRVFSFRVRRSDAVGNTSAYSVPYTFVVDKTAPSSPVSLAQTSTPSSNDVTPSFTWVALEAGGEFEWDVRTPVADGGVSVVPANADRTTPSTSATTPALELSAGQTYNLRFLVRQLDGVGNASSFAEIPLVVDLTPPSGATISIQPPANALPGFTNGNSVPVALDAPAVDDITASPAIAYALNTSATQPGPASFNVLPFPRTLALGGPDATYSVNLWARDVAGNVAIVATQTVVRDTKTPTIAGSSDPRPGSNLETAFAPTGNLDITFSEPVQDPTDPVVRLKLCLDPCSGPGLPTVQSFDSSGLALLVDPQATLATSTKYEIEVDGLRDRASNLLSGPGGTQAWTFTTAADSTPPGEATGLTLTAGVGQIDVSWVNPTDGDFQGVRVLRYTSAPTGPNDSKAARFDLNAPTSTLSDVGLKPGTRYFYAVYARDTVGNFAVAATGNAVPDAPAGATPPPAAAPPPPPSTTSATPPPPTKVSTAKKPTTRQAKLMKPIAGKMLTSLTPTLSWKYKPRGTTLYNLQIHIGTKKIMSVFPKNGSYKVPKGILKPGQRYTWHVWEYYGATKRYAKKPITSWFDTAPSKSKQRSKR